MKIPEFTLKFNADYIPMKANDLEAMLLKKGIEIASHGRINWDACKNKSFFSSINDAAKFIAEKKGASVIFLSNQASIPIKTSNTNIAENLPDILDEDWDCWIIGGDWVLEKYHDDEKLRICFVENR